MMTRHPFQKLCCVQSDPQKPALLLAASGPSVTSFSLLDGSVTARYPNFSDADSDSEDTEEDRDADRPAKRRRLERDGLEPSSRQESEDSIEIVAERQKGQRRRPKVEDPKLPNISHLVPTTDGRYLVAVTAEDKSISVFAVSTPGRFSLKSRRVMPKRLCAVKLTSDDTTIIAGDKFGDVYSLPLHPSKDFVPVEAAPDKSSAIFTPSATELTVHTKGNLEALRQQREQKKFNAKKEVPVFEYKLLLGHVSLLTDVTIVEVKSGQKMRQYILSADRDEHIRVSRGLSQAYIIENYCLGHREFVSRILLLPWAPEFLVSGSGEPSVKLYHWQSGRLLDEEMFDGATRTDLVLGIMLEHGVRSIDKLAVSGIWPVQCNSSFDNLILVSVEGLPILFSYSISGEGKLKHHQTIQLSGNVLDVAVRAKVAIASIDTVHKPGSMNVTKPDELPNSAMFEAFELCGGVQVEANGASERTDDAIDMGPRWESSSLAIGLNAAMTREKVAADVPSTGPNERSRSKRDYSTLGEFLYGLENLRKKRGIGGEGAEGQDIAEGDPGEIDVE